MDFDRDEDTSPFQFEPTSTNWRSASLPSDLHDVIHAARHAIGATSASRLGPLSLTPRLLGRDWTRAIQIRSRPLADFGGAEFRHNVMLGDLAAHYPVKADGLASGFRAFLASSVYTGGFGAMVRTMATEAIGRHDHCGSPPQILAIGLEPVPDPGVLVRFAAVVDLAVLGPDLAPRTIRVRRFTHDHLISALNEALILHAKRAKILCRHLKRGSACWIEDTTLRLIEMAGLTRSELQRYLRTYDYFTLKFDFGRQWGCIEWRDGVLACDAHSRKSSYLLKNNSLTLHQHFPETLMMGLKGRKLGELVAHDWLPPDAVIKGAVKNRNGTRLPLKVGRTPLDLREGREVFG